MNGRASRPDATLPTLTGAGDSAPLATLRSHARRAVVAVALIAGLLAVPAPAVASGQAGRLDPSFGGDGTVLTDFGVGSDAGAAVVVQPDGRVVAGGAANTGQNGWSEFVLTRYTTNGSLDPSFGVAGKVITPITGNGSVLNALVLRPDGKLLAAGAANDFVGVGDFALARYNSDGSLDLRFGDGGVVTTDLGGNDGIRALAAQADGKLVVAGYTQTEGGIRIAVVRYHANGRLDVGFGSGGIVITGAGLYSSEASAVVVLPDGDLVVAGLAETATNGDFTLIRYRSNGRLDPRFGDGGVVTTDFSGRDIVGALIVQGDRLVAAGSSMGVDSNFALARYRFDGSLDPDFGVGGRVMTGFGAGQINLAYALIAQGSRLIVAGCSTSGVGFDFALARYRYDGTLDRAFGSAGSVVTDFLGGPDQAEALALQPDGRIVAVGTAFHPDGGFSDIALARYLAR